MPKIKIKAKKCKGTGRASGYGCTKESLWRKYGLCRECYTRWLLSTHEGKKVLEKARLTASKRVERDRKKAEKQRHEKRKSIQKIITEVRPVFQRWIKMRDANRGCVSCDTTDSKIYDAGHFKKAEVYTGLIFDERNVHKQCRKCNTYLNGNEGEYRKRLLARFGSEWLAELDADADRLRKYSFTRDELSEIKTEYARRIRENEF